MRVVSLNIGLPREVLWHGRQVLTGIFKQPVRQRLALRKLNLDGDRQADLTVHGGESKAVYCYPLEHYEYWKQQLPGRDLPPAAFGENFTTQGLLEDVHLGDTFSPSRACPATSSGSGSLMDDMVKRFLDARRTGFYLAVVREGEVGAGDQFRPVARDPLSVPISEITRLFVAKSYRDEDVASIERALQVAALPESWKDYFRKRLPQAFSR